MGGAAGHMSHPFDDNHLTFGDFKNIINMSLEGKLSREDNVTEKTDGQNLMISWKDGKLMNPRVHRYFLEIRNLKLEILLYGRRNQVIQKP